MSRKIRWQRSKHEDDVFELTLGERGDHLLRASIVWGHRDYPNEWVLHCHPFFDTTPLGVKNKTKAKHEALKRLRRVLRPIADDLDRVEVPR